MRPRALGRSILRRGGRAWHPISGGTTMRLDEFLSERHVPFQKMPHQPAYTANRIAQTLHVPGREVAKSVLLRTGHGHILAVVPATHRVDLDEIRDCLGEETVEMAPEEDMDQL